MKRLLISLAAIPMWCATGQLAAQTEFKFASSAPPTSP